MRRTLAVSLATVLLSLSLGAIAAPQPDRKSVV